MVRSQVYLSLARCSARRVCVNNLRRIMFEDAELARATQELAMFMAMGYASAASDAPMTTVSTTGREPAQEPAETSTIRHQCNVKLHLCLIEITSVLLLCYQSMYRSCNTTALHVVVVADVKVLGSQYSSARSESGKGQRRQLACLLYTLAR